MKLKFFSFLALFFAVAFTANAQQIAGTYNGTMIVEVVVPEPNVVPFPNQDIIITDEGGGLVKLSILNFSFMGFDIGNLEVSGISATNTGGTTTLSKAGFSNGPSVDVGLGELPTVITLNTANITSGGVLMLDLSVDLYVEYVDSGFGVVLQENVANVTFTGNRSTGIFSPNAEKITIYPTVATDVIVVEGFENAGYTIFNPSGISVKQGKISTETISVSALNTGVYILNINGISATFIKR